MSAPVASASAVLKVEAPLLSRPVSDASALPGSLPKGARVTRFANFGPYALVQDPQGRAGYVLEEKGAGHRGRFPPPPAPVPAVDKASAAAVPVEGQGDGGVAPGECRAEAGEKDSTGCVMRAQAGLTDCKDACAADGTEGCAEECQGRYDDCVASCTGAKAGAKPLGWGDAPTKSPKGPRKATKAKAKVGAKPKVKGKAR